jgi:hypothetical protein
MSFAQLDRDYKHLWVDNQVVSIFHNLILSLHVI